MNEHGAAVAGAPVTANELHATRHADHLASVREGLAALGFAVDDELRARVGKDERRATRLTFTPADGEGGLGSALVVTRAAGSSEVRGLPSGRGRLLAGEVAVRLEGVARSRFLPETATNDEVRRFTALRDSLPVESVAEVGGALGDAGAHRLHFALTHPERVERHELRSVLGLLTALSDGAPVEWVARRALAVRPGS